MKKTISVILLLALCLSLFAGCKDKAPAELTNLERAKALVFNAYKPAKKDEVPVKSADFEVMTGVLVDGQTYPVAWAVEVTAGPADAVKIVDGSSDDFKKVDVTEKPDEEVNFTLTATLSDGDGNTATVSFKFKTLKAEAPAASKVVIKLVKDGNYATGTEYEYTSSSSGKKKMELVLSTTKADAVAFNMIENDDGSVTFKTDDGYFLFCDASNVKFVKEQDDNTKFVLEAAEGGHFIKCAVATYQEKAQYLEVYSGYLTCYGMGSDASIYIFDLEDAAGAAGKVSVLEGSGDNAPAETDPPVDNSNDPAADSTLSIADAIALGASKPHNNYTTNKYYVTGVITEVYSEQYGNMRLTDASGNILTIYGTFDADGSNRYDAMSVKPVAGDTVTIYGIVGQYNDSPQIKNGWITSHTPAAGGSGTSEGAAAATLDMMGTTNLSNRTTTQTVYSANAITYTNDKSSSQTDNYDQTGTYAARAYKGSSIKIEYTGMTKIVFTLDDYSSGKYLEGFDGMTVSGATITRNGDKVTVTFSAATDVFQSTDLASQVRIEKIEVFTN